MVEDNLDQRSSYFYNGKFSYKSDQCSQINSIHLSITALCSAVASFTQCFLSAYTMFSQVLHSLVSDGTHCFIKSAQFCQTVHNVLYSVKSYVHKVLSHSVKSCTPFSQVLCTVFSSSSPYFG